MRRATASVYAGCLGLSPVISAKNHFSNVQMKWNWNGKKFTETPILGFQGIDVAIHGKLVSSACYEKQQVCVYLQPIWC